MRQHLVQALSYRRGDPDALIILTRMDMKEKRDDLAEQHATELLHTQPNSAYRRGIMG